LSSQDNVSATFSFSQDLQAIDFNLVTVSTPYAHFTFMKEFVPSAGAVLASNMAWRTEASNSVDPWSLWSVPPIVLLLLIWRLNKYLRLRLKFWVAPFICIAILSANLLMIMREAEIQSQLLATQEKGVNVEMSEIKELIISLPLPEEAEDEASQWLIHDESGAPIFSSYNTVTNCVDGVVTKSGSYTLKKSELDFQDIASKSDLMRDSIRSLAALNIMPGTSDGMFFPDKTITRAEFVCAILRIFRLVDPTATSTFSDISEDDWYYRDVASAQKLKVIDGFAEDNTFRGDLELAKDQMVAISMRSLAKEMGYPALPEEDLDYMLSRYADYEDIPDWARADVALAAQAGLALYRADLRFAPKGGMTRGDAAIMLRRVLDKAW
jgi:hypothetical protein